MLSKFIRSNFSNLKSNFKILSFKELYKFNNQNYSTDLRSKLKLLKDDLINKLKENNDGWTRFYRFNHIKIVSMITKAKIYMTIFTVVIFCDSYYRYLNNENNLNNLILLNSLTIFSLVFLIIMGQLSRRIIGIAYHDSTNINRIRLAVLTFTGRRKNLILNIKDISPLSDTNTAKDALFHKLVINLDGKNKTFYLANNDLATIDDQIYKKVFGVI